MNKQPVIVFEDNDLFIVNKPEGVYCHKNYPDHQVNCLVDYYQHLMKFAEDDLRQGLAHRLDRDTSGLVIMAKHPDALEKLMMIFKNREIKKKYQAWVHKHCFESEKLLVDYLARDDRKRNLVKVVDKDRVKTSRRAETLINPMSYYKNTTLLDVEIFTGRTHQIRVQLAKLGHPVVGDLFYGEKSYSSEGKSTARHLFLCANHLEFLHPYTQELISINISLPDFFQEQLDKQKNFKLGVH